MCTRLDLLGVRYGLGLRGGPVISLGAVAVFLVAGSLRPLLLADGRHAGGGVQPRGLLAVLRGEVSAPDAFGVQQITFVAFVLL